MSCPVKGEKLVAKLLLKHSIRRTSIEIANLTHLKRIKKVWATGYLP